MKLIRISIILLITTIQLNCLGQNLTIGWANSGIRFIVNNENYNEGQHNFLTPGVELQVGYRLNSTLTFTTGINFQSASFETKVVGYEQPNEINSSLLRDLSIPLLVGFDFVGKESVYYRLTAGIYYVIPQSALIGENHKIYGGGGYNASGIYYFISADYATTYLGGSIHKIISPKWEIFAEPFICYQLNENDLSRNVRERFWFGIKIGMSYSLKLKKE